MKPPLIVLEERQRAADAPSVPFRHLAALWVQITGTWCNLECVHCINASGPDSPWLPPLDGESVRRAIREAEGLGVKEIYFTGGEPFLHHEILPLLEEALAVAPTTVLTNGTAITPPVADALAALAAAASYSLEIRVSLDDVDREANDRVRGRGAWVKAVQAIQRLHARGLLPIVTATEIGRARGEDSLAGFDTSVLQCSDTRVVAHGGVFACPILAGLDGARLSTGSLEASFRPASLYHAACVTCHRTGMTCRNG
jgi:sulfatase maturation enzyme AslB (radical SAM superfamily)